MFQIRCNQHQRTIFCKNCQLFGEKLKVLSKASDFCLPSLHWCWMLRSMISKKFYYFQTTKVVNSKDVIC